MKNHPAPVGEGAADNNKDMKMDDSNSYDLEPMYSTNEISGKCLKCLTEQELNSCLIQLLREEGISPEVQHKYEALVDFLKSPESEQLRKESERCLAEGKKVSVRIYTNNGQPKYELIVK